MRFSLLCWLLISPVLAGAAVCKGADPCKACKDCTACAYCDPKNPKGGSCGTCRAQEGAAAARRVKARR